MRVSLSSVWRLALVYQGAGKLATPARLEPVITRAIGHPGAAERDPVSLATGAANRHQAHPHRHRQVDHHRHKKATADSTLGQVITRLLAWLPGSK